MRYLLVTPPFVQLNTPYPATMQLKGYLVAQGHQVKQCDIGIETAEKIFCRSFMEGVFAAAFQKDRLSARAKEVAMKKDRYLSTIDAVWNFLKGKDNTLYARIATREFLPEATLFKKLKDDDLEWAYGTTGMVDRAKYLATLYIEDLALFVGDVYNCDFSLVRYQESIAIAASSFDAIYSALQQELNPIESVALDVFSSHFNTFTPDVVAISIPFPGTMVMGLRVAQMVKKCAPDVIVAMGGGYINTELRTITDCRVFEFIDFMLFDDGEVPLTTLCDHLEGRVAKSEIIAAKYVENGEVVSSKEWKKCLDFDSLPAPDFSDIDFSKYISLVEFTNPMHRLWSDGQWNKMTVAHGCYWAKCAFCDTSIDYIGRYSAPRAVTVVNRMESIMKQSGITGFHFTDEALPPKLLREIAQEIIARGLVVSFWGNIRFEKSFDTELCNLLAQAGCVAVSGGLEVVAPRLLKLINKGVTLEGAIKCCTAFNSAAIMVHAYLMYGFAGEEDYEAVESLEIVRQMFEQGIVQSAFWHRFVMTVHSPAGLNPQQFGAEIVSSTTNSFANNGVEFTDNSSADWDEIGVALKRATQNFMNGRGYDLPMKNWFGGKYSNPKISKRYVEEIIDSM